MFLTKSGLNSVYENNNMLRVILVSNCNINIQMTCKNVYTEQECVNSTVHRCPTLTIIFYFQCLMKFGVRTLI